MIRDAAGVIAAGLAAPDMRAALDAVGDRYAVLIPDALRSLIHDPAGPIGRQFIPHPDELLTAPHEHPDPIGDDRLSPVPGIVHRYADRALLKPLLICPTYCRFCFRREHVGPDGGLLTDAQLSGAYAWLRAHPAVREVILTGGDPLMLSPRRLAAIVAELNAIPHIELIRVHTRVPVADPARVTCALAAALASAAPVWMVVHVNHVDELTPGAIAALDAIRAEGVPLLSQSVLLRGVNDSADALAALFRALLRARVKPYYLHQLDPAPGTARFAVPVAEGQAILRALRGRLTGLAWPTYVIDIPGGHGKVPAGPSYLGPGVVHDPGGLPHPYPAE